MRAGRTQSYLLPITNGQQGPQTSSEAGAQKNQVRFPSAELPMAPINTSQTPQPRPQTSQSHGHSRTSSFFSFRNKLSSSSPSSGHLRASSLGNGNGITAGELGHMIQGSLSGQVQAPQSSVQQPPAVEKTLTGTPPVRTLTKQRPSNQSILQPQPQPQPQPQAAPPPLHPEIRSVLQLTSAHTRKVYFSGPLVRHVERSTDGQRKEKDEGWHEIWAQLGGTTLSIWDMTQIQEASKQGKEVPPTYVNTTDAFVQVLGSLTTPATSTTPAKKYSNVFTLNTAGNNLLLFSCPDPHALISWAAALRLSAWEKSRLEEIYTAHLLRITLKQPNARTPLARGHMEGWVRIRLAGTRDWKRMWMVISAGTEGSHSERLAVNGGIGSTPTPVATLPKKRRVSNLFSRENSSTPPPPMPPILSMYASQKPKDKKKALLTLKNVTQVFAVYPERPELISRSTLIKVEGRYGDEETAAAMKSREGWLLIMPEVEDEGRQAEEMLNWVTGIHDAFELYGRPEAWTWDPRDPASLMFAYPVGPNKDLLFLDRELAEALDPRDEHTSSIRSRLIGILLDRMRGVVSVPRPITADKPPTLPPVGESTNASQQQASIAPAQQPGPSSNFQLPPLSFVGTAIPEEEKPLSPVRKQSNTESSSSPYGSPQAPPPQNNYVAQTKPQEYQEVTLLDRPVATSPVPVSPPHSITGAEPSGRAPSVQSTGITSLGRTSFDTPSANRGFQAPSRVASTVSSASAFSKPESKAHSDAVSPILSKSPLSSEPSRALSPATSAIAQSSSAYTSPSPSAPTPPPAPVAGLEPSLISVKRTTSVLTSPHSILTQEDDTSNDRASVLTSPFSVSAHPTLTSPYSPRGTIRSLDGRSSLDQPASSRQTYGTLKSEDSGNILNEAGALYYMQQQLESDDVHHRRVPTTINEQTDSDSDDDSSSQHASSKQATRAGAVSPASNDSAHSRQHPVRQSTPMAFFERSSPQPSNVPVAAVSADRSSPSRQGLGRKPSGARAQAITRSFNAADSISSHQVTEENETQTQSEDHYETPLQAKMNQLQAQPSASSDADLDALAALSYLAVDDKPESPKAANVEPLNIHKTPSPQLVDNETPAQFRSSFAPSKGATERKAKAQAQQVAHHNATHKPGRTNGKRKSRVAGGWNESSDEEEEDEDEDDEDADSDAEPSLSNKQAAFASSSTSLQQQRQLQPGEPAGTESQAYSHLRPPRSLPQVPGNNYTDEYNPPPRRMPSEQFSAAGAPPPRMYHDGTQIRTQAEFPQPGAARQTVWSQVLDPGRAANIEPPRNDTFVQLEPAETMTKAFTPQGLLSAGIQDKQDRSAKRQEELARETGASLINVPNKPPPPQMGLLGAITAHERERKREGGVGAALTEREREKRVAEDRQRRFDDHQRQQLDQMQQGGSMYGGQFPAYGMNPMMMNPMMGMNPMMAGGMNPMMTGGMNPMMGQAMGGGMAPMMTGFPGMMPGYNPQHFFAAQQAAQAYQQAMMAFSVAGSQVGPEGGGGTTPLNPAMTGSMGFDPRMSMMGMPMMGQMNTMNPMGMQMTGMSTFDPRFPPNGNDSGLAPPVGLGGQDAVSRNSSPAQRSSPLARQTDSGGPSPRAESPKN